MEGFDYDITKSLGHIEIKIRKNLIKIDMLDP